MPRSPPAAESRHRLCGVLQHLQRPTAVPISLDAAAAAAPVAALSTSLRQLGARAAKVRATALGLGGVCWNEDDVQWMQNVHAAVKLGVKYFDTAPAYGNGLSEHRMGLALRTYERDSFVLSTKVGYYLRPAVEGPTPPSGSTAQQASMPFDMEFDYSYGGIMRQFEDSLQRLGMARVDCLVIHGVDYSGKTVAEVDRHLDILETGGIRALIELRANGKIGAIGLGVNEECPVIREHSGGTVEEAAMWNRGFVDRVTGMAGGAAVDFLLLAGIHTLLNQTAFTSGVLRICEQRGVGVVMGGPLNSGILTDDMATNNFVGATYSYRPAPEPVLARARLIAQVAAEHGVSLTAAALQFPLGFANMAVIIPGGATPEQVADNKAAMDTVIPVAFWKALLKKRLLPEGCPCPTRGPATQKWGL